MALVEGDQLLRAVDHALDVDVALGQERREPLHLAHAGLLLPVLSRICAAAAAWRGLSACRPAAPAAATATAHHARPDLLRLRERGCRCRRHIGRPAAPDGIRAQHEGQQDRGQGYDVRRVEQGQVGHVVVVDDGHGDVDLVLGQEQVGLEARQGPVRLVHDQVGVHLRDKEELALAEAPDVEGEQICVAVLRLAMCPIV